MQAARKAWLAPAAYSFFGSALYLVLGEPVALAIAVWFAWCMTRGCDADHQLLRLLGWIMLISIPVITLGRVVLGE